MDQTSRSASATRPPGGSEGRPARRWPWIALRMIVAGVLLSIPIVPLAFFLVPIPADADGVTICLPALGPLRQFSEDLSPEDRAAVRVHEGVHADQCRRLGAVEYARTYLDTEGRLGLEAEAYCAEVAVLGLRGEDPVRVVDRTVETLFTEYRRDQALERVDVARIVEARCAPVDGIPVWRVSLGRAQRPSSRIDPDPVSSSIVPRPSPSRPSM